MSNSKTFEVFADILLFCLFLLFVFGYFFRSDENFDTFISKLRPFLLQYEKSEEIQNRERNRNRKLERVERIRIERNLQWQEIGSEAFERNLQRQAKRFEKSQQKKSKNEKKKRKRKTLKAKKIQNGKEQVEENGLSESVKFQKLFKWKKNKTIRITIAPCPEERKLLVFNKSVLLPLAMRISSLKSYLEVAANPNDEKIEIVLIVKMNEQTLVLDLDTTIEAITNKCNSKIPLTISYISKPLFDVLEKTSIFKWS